MIVKREEEGCEKVQGVLLFENVFDGDMACFRDV